MARGPNVAWKEPLSGPSSIHKSDEEINCIFLNKVPTWLGTSARFAFPWQQVVSRCAIKTKKQCAAGLHEAGNWCNHQHVGPRCRQSELVSLTLSGCVTGNIPIEWTLRHEGGNEDKQINFAQAWNAFQGMWTGTLRERAGRRTKVTEGRTKGRNGEWVTVQKTKHILRFPWRWVRLD